MNKLLTVLSLIGVIYGFLFASVCFALSTFCSYDAVVTSVNDARTTDRYTSEITWEYFNNRYEEDATIAYNNKEYHTTIDGESKKVLPKVGDTVAVCISKYTIETAMTVAHAEENTVSGLICLAFGVMGLCVSYFAENTNR